MPQTPSISIVICTRNRARALVRTLDSVAAAVAAYPDIEAELVVVDNGSTDGTGDMLRAWKTTQAFQVSIIEEARAGLSHARNAGLGAARHGILAMTDDDCEVAADYLAAISSAYASGEDLKICGGRVELGDPQDLPITIMTGDTPRTYTLGRKPGGFILGANMTMHRRVFEAVGLFDPRFGAGARFLAAEDTDYILRASRLGFAVTYDPTIVVRHFHGRRTRDEAVQLAAGYCFGDGALYAKHFFRSLVPAKVLKATVVNAAREALGKFEPDPLLGRQFAFRLVHNCRGFVHYTFASGAHD